MNDSSFAQVVGRLDVPSESDVRLMIGDAERAWTRVLPGWATDVLALRDAQGRGMVWTRPTAEAWSYGRAA